MRTINSFALLLLLALAIFTPGFAMGKREGARKLNGYSGSWSGSWGSVSVNGASGSWSSPYGSGSWGGGSSGGSTGGGGAATTQTVVNDKQATTAQAPSPGEVYYNGDGVLVQKLPNGQTQTIVNNEYANVNVVGGRRR